MFMSINALDLQNLEPCPFYTVFVKSFRSIGWSYTGRIDIRTGKSTIQNLNVCISSMELSEDSKRAN